MVLTLILFFKHYCYFLNINVIFLTLMLFFIEQRPYGKFVAAAGQAWGRL